MPRFEGRERGVLWGAEIGDLAGVEIEAMRFGWDVVIRGSVAEGARLEIIPIPGLGFCAECQRKVPVLERFDACPGCGGYDLEVTEGEQMKIKEIEVE